MSTCYDLLYDLSSGAKLLLLKANRKSEPVSARNLAMPGLRARRAEV